MSIEMFEPFKIFYQADVNEAIILLLLKLLKIV